MAMNKREQFELSSKEQAYCLARAAGMTQLAAYRASRPHSKATDSTACTEARRIERRPRVRQRIAELKVPVRAEVVERIQSTVASEATAAVTGLAERIRGTKEWVIDELVENVKMAKAAVPVLDRQGRPTGEYRVNIAAANRALHLLGLELGMFRGGDSNNENDPLAGMSPEQLRKLKVLVDAFIADACGTNGMPQ
jgi:hypothetical protein